MPKILVCGRGGSGKSTLVALLAGWLGEDGKALVVDADSATLAKEARRDFSAVLNKVSGETESVLREMLASKGIEIEGVLAHSPALARAGLRGLPLNTALLRPELVQLRAGLGGVLASE